MLSYVWHLLGWCEDSSTSHDTNSTENSDTKADDSKTNSEPVNNDLVSRSEYPNRWPCFVRGDQYVTIEDLSKDVYMYVSSYFVIPIDDAIFAVACVSKFHKEPFDHILAVRFGDFADFNISTPKERMTRLVNNFRQQMQEIEISKSLQSDVYNDFLKMSKHEMNKIKCDNHGFVCAISDKMSKKYGIEQYDQLIVLKNAIKIKKLPNVMDDGLPQLEM